MLYVTRIRGLHTGKLFSKPSLAQVDTGHTECNYAIDKKNVLIRTHVAPLNPKNFKF